MSHVLHASNKDIEEQSEKEKRKWYTRRTLVSWIGLIQQSLLYFEHSAVLISALFYYQNLFDVENPKFYYILSLGSYMLSGMTSVMICGYYMDRTRNLRRICLTSLALLVIGNIVYVMTYSRWLPILGRLFCGINNGVRPPLTGECSCKIY